MGSVSWVDSFGIDGGNNLDQDPMFVNAAMHNLELMQGSPAINAGANDSLPMEAITDFNGSPRIVDGRVDMGAFEFQTCHNTLILNETDSPLIGSYFSSTSITIEGLSEISVGGNININAPSVLINSVFSMPLMQQMEIFNSGCP